MAGNCQVFAHQTLDARSRAPSPIWTHALRGFDPRSPLQPSLALRASYGLASQCATIVQLPPPSADVSHLSAEDARSFANDSTQRLLLLHPIPVHVTVAPSIALVTYVLTKRPLKPQYMYLRSPES